jgi:hypothetical protein
LEDDLVRRDFTVNAMAEDEDGNLIDLFDGMWALENKMLLTPGPTPVPEFVRVAMSGETIHHRTPEFEEISKADKLIREVLTYSNFLYIENFCLAAHELIINSVEAVKRKQNNNHATSYYLQC